MGHIFSALWVLRRKNDNIIRLPNELTVISFQFDRQNKLASHIHGVMHGEEIKCHLSLFEWKPRQTSGKFADVISKFIFLT